MSAWAKPGVKCVCVIEGYVGPRLKEVCTVDEILTDARGVWILLCEYGWYHTDISTTAERRRPWFRVERFRPLITQQDDVALFAHLLTGTPVRELVE